MLRQNLLEVFKDLLKDTIPKDKTFEVTLDKFVLTYEFIEYLTSQEIRDFIHRVVNDPILNDVVECIGYMPDATRVAHFHLRKKIRWEKIEPLI